MVTCHFCDGSFHSNDIRWVYSPSPGTDRTTVIIAKHADYERSVACCMRCLYVNDQMVEPPTVHPDGTRLGRKRSDQHPRPPTSALDADGSAAPFHGRLDATALKVSFEGNALPLTDISAWTATRRLAAPSSAPGVQRVCGNQAPGGREKAPTSPRCPCPRGRSDHEAARELWPLALPRREWQRAPCRLTG
jgi:hypothetical protein